MSTQSSTGGRETEPGGSEHDQSLGASEALLGAAFTTPKELRHIAEQTLDRLFVPTEVVSEHELDADLLLRPDGLGEVHVHAEREQPWTPLVVTRVDSVER
jgi:hypothetical protein